MKNLGAVLGRVLLLALVSSALVVGPTTSALACSCFPISPATDMDQFDAAFVGRLVQAPERNGEYDERAEYVFEVDTWVKGDGKDTVIVLSPNRGSACGFEVLLQKQVGILVNITNGEMLGGLCSTVNQIYCLP